MLILFTLADGATSLDPNLDLAAKEIDSYQAMEALVHLDRARTEEPHSHADHVRLYELYGMAYAYLQREEEALEAFEMVLDLDPGYSVSCILSPKVTFIFEQARKRARKRQVPSIHLSWPLDLKTTDPVPVFVEVVADPRGFLKRAKLQVHRKGTNEGSSREFSLPPPGKHTRVVLPPITEESRKPEVLQLHLIAYDGRGNQVLLVGSAHRPREIFLGHEEPLPWYREWWIWAIAGGCVAAGSGVTVWLLNRDMPETIGGGIRTR